MRKFVPVEPFTRVEFASPAGLVTVEKDGLTVPETQAQEVSVLNEETGEYETQTQQLPANGDLFAALEEHEQIREVPVKSKSDDSKE